MAGMTFNGTTSSSMNIDSAVPIVPVLPNKQSSTVKILGRDGTVDYDNDSYEPRMIPVQCVVTADTEAELTGYLADIAVWLSGSGNLLFDADATKQWSAKVYNSIEPTRVPLIAVFTVIFECQPYATAVTETTGATVDSATDYASDCIFYPTVNVSLTADAAYVQVTLASTGEYVRIEDSLTNGDDIVFNMATGKVTVNGSSAMDKVTLASIFFGVPTGSQTINVTATSTYTADMDYYKRYLYA